MLNVDFSYVDSNKTTQTKPLAIFYFYRRGYVRQLDEYYRGIPNHAITFDRRFGKRIKSSTFNYLDEDGRFLDDFGPTITEYSYSKRGVKTKTRSARAEFPEDSVGTYQVVKYNADGLQIKSFNQYHYENGSIEDYHSTMRSEMLFSEDGSSVIRNSYLEDTLWTREDIALTEFGREERTELFYSVDPSEVIGINEYEYNSEGQYLHMKSLSPAKDKVYTECEDRGNFDLYFTYKNGLLESVLYTYEGTEIKISFSYQ